MLIVVLLLWALVIHTCYRKDGLTEIFYNNVEYNVTTTKYIKPTGLWFKDKLFKKQVVSNKIII